MSNVSDMNVQVDNLLALVKLVGELRDQLAQARENTAQVSALYIATDDALKQAEAKWAVERQQREQAEVDPQLPADDAALARAEQAEAALAAVPVAAIRSAEGRTWPSLNSDLEITAWLASLPAEPPAHA